MNHDYSRCLIDFTECPKGVKLTDHFPELGAFKEFQEVPNENYIKIAIATADIESPMVKIKDRETMLNTLFEFLEIPVRTKEDKSFYQEVFLYKNPVISNCKYRYLQLLHNTDWTEWVTVNETFDFLTRQALIPKSDTENDDSYIKKRVNIKEKLRATGRDLKELEAIIFPDSKTAREQAELEAKRKIIGYPEKYAQERTVI